jgi:Skp family chaperone for outer membrane proteins
MADLRSALEEAFSTDPVEEVREEQQPEPIEVQEEGSHDEPQEEIVEESKPIRPTTWKKEYLPIWDKIQNGEELSSDERKKHLEYLNQRESEYKKGVNTYKAEADRFKPLDEAIAPFREHLKQQNINEAQWINNLGRAHLILSQAPPEQKIQMFHRLAQDYGIQLNQGEMQKQQIDPYTQQLMQQLQHMNQEVGTIKSRYEQEENNRLMSEINRVSSDVEKYPHFELLRLPMAQLLERGDARDLDDAYLQAEWTVPEVRELKIQQLVSKTNNQTSNQQRVAKAKSTALSPRSVTPSGISTTVDKKDRRSVIEEQLNQSMGGRV